MFSPISRFVPKTLRRTGRSSLASKLVAKKTPNMSDSIIVGLVIVATVALSVAAESSTSAFETIPLVLYIVEIIFTAVEVMFAALLAKAWKRSKGGAGAVAPVIARKNEQSNED